MVGGQGGVGWWEGREGVGGCGGGGGRVLSKKEWVSGWVGLFQHV